MIDKCDTFIFRPQYVSCVCTEPAPTVPRSKVNWILAKAPEDKRHGCRLGPWASEGAQLLGAMA